MSEREGTLTPEEAAAHPRYGKFGNANWYRSRMRTGKLWATKVGGRWFTDEQAIEEMAEAGQNFKRRRRNRAIA